MSKSRKILCLHHTDLDGAMSGGIVGLWAEKNDFKVTYHLYNYGYPLTPELFKGYELVFAVDISFHETDPWVYDYLSDRLIWIDHHKTAIDYAERNNLGSISGLRRVGVGACELVWEYLFEGLRTPRLVQYLSAYDVWDKSRFDWKIVEQIQWGCRQEYGVSAKDLCNYLKLIECGLTGYLEELREKGESILGYLEKNFRGKLKNYGFYAPEFTVEGVGSFRVMLLNTNEFTSKTFESLYNPEFFDIMIPFCLCPIEGSPGKFEVRLSFYTENPNIDVSKIAEIWGGGGHKGAAGASVSLETLGVILSCCMSLKEFCGK